MAEETKAELYKRVGIGTRAGFGKKPALIVIDVQKGFTLDECPLGGGLDEMIENINDVVGVAKKKNVPIIYTVVAWRPDSGDGGMILKKIPPLSPLPSDQGGLSWTIEWTITRIKIILSSRNTSPAFLEPSF